MHESSRSGQHASESIFIFISKICVRGVVRAAGPMPPRGGGAVAFGWARGNGSKSHWGHPRMSHPMLLRICIALRVRG